MEGLCRWINRCFLSPADIIVTTNGDPVTSKEIKSCIHQIQDLIVVRLNQAVANKLISSVDYLRESFVGTLERCLNSLEKSHIESSVHNITSNHLKQVSGCVDLLILWLRYEVFLPTLSSNAVIKCCLSRGGHLSLRLFCHKALLGANQTGQLLTDAARAVSIHPTDIWMTEQLDVSSLVVDNSQDNLCEPSCHHARVETKSGPGCHRKSQCCQTGQKHLFPVQNSPQQLPRGFCSIPATGDAYLFFLKTNKTPV